MKADNAIHLDPATVCIVDAKSAFDPSVPSSTAPQCRRAAQELCVIRRSMQALCAECRLLPHDSMIADAHTQNTETAGPC